jgi:PiT family inorganic phosphate transporter
MLSLEFFIICSALYVGWNIGANDAANAMGAAVGSGMISYRKGIIIVSAFVLLGAVVFGYRVMKTIGAGIINPKHITEHKESCLAILLSSALFVSAITFKKIPVSTSQAIVGSVIGAGLAMRYFYGLDVEMQTTKLKFIGFSWVCLPFFSGIVAIIIYNILSQLIRVISFVHYNLIYSCLLSIGGVIVAFNLGANDVANAVGPIVSAEVLETIDTGVSFKWRAPDGPGHVQLKFRVPIYSIAAILGGLAMIVGITTFSKGVVDTVGKNITLLDVKTACAAQLAAGASVFFFTYLGIPVSTTQAIVGGIGGVGFLKGVQTVDIKVLKNIFLGWFITPTISGIIAFLLMGLYTCIF